jgi:hypothetical protein
MPPLVGDDGIGGNDKCSSRVPTMARAHSGRVTASSVTMSQTKTEEVDKGGDTMCACLCCVWLVSCLFLQVFVPYCNYIIESVFAYFYIKLQ